VIRRNDVVNKRLSKALQAKAKGSNSESRLKFSGLRNANTTSHPQLLKTSM
jgi:hypothetical protein